MFSRGKLVRNAIRSGRVGSTCNVCSQLSSTQSLGRDTERPRPERMEILGTLPNKHD